MLALSNHEFNFWGKLQCNAIRALIEIMFITARVQWTRDGQGAEKWSRCRNSLFPSFQNHPPNYICVGGEVG